MFDFLIKKDAKELLEAIKNNPNEFYTIRFDKDCIAFGGKYVMTATIDMKIFNIAERYIIKKTLRATAEKIDKPKKI
jgi:hypothetical protein